MREVWNAENLAAAAAALKSLVAGDRDNAPPLALWLETAGPEALAVFALPEHHRKRMRTANPIERAVQPELERRTAKARVFPNNASLRHLVTAVLSRSTTHGCLQHNPTSTGTTRMLEWAINEFPDSRLRNRVIETAKLSGFDPEAYLANILARSRDHDPAKLDDMLPWNWSSRQPATAKAA